MLGHGKARQSNGNRNVGLRSGCIPQGIPRLLIQPFHDSRARSTGSKVLADSANRGGYERNSLAVIVRGAAGRAFSAAFAAADSQTQDRITKVIVAVSLFISFSFWVLESGLKVTGQAPQF